MAGLEPATTRSQSVYATNCATSRVFFIYINKYILYITYKVIDINELWLFNIYHIFQIFPFNLKNHIPLLPHF